MHTHQTQPDDSICTRHLWETLMNLIWMRPLGIAVLALAFTAFGALAQAEENFMKDPSFESLRAAPDQFGHLFEEHLGWVYDQPGRMADGTIAHTGKHSYEIINGKGGKTRFQSHVVKLEPGRYRASVFVRGLDVVGTYTKAMDFYFFDGIYHAMKVPATFGWTPVSYVFQVDKTIENVQMMVGLVGNGYVWIDDISLEKVGNGVELTPKPVMGKEEAPIAPPGKMGESAVRCPECGYRNNPEWDACYACGTPIAARKAAIGPPVKVLFDFENGKTEPFTGGDITTENAPQGKSAMIVRKDSAICNQPQDWSGYDMLKIDAFNPLDNPVMLYLEIRDSLSTNYWTRVNYSTVLPPGKSTVTLPTDMYVGEKGHHGRPLIKSKVTFMCLAPQKWPVIFDNIRLERLDTAIAKFPGLVAYDFGLPASPVMPGYTQITAGTLYTAGRGYGWNGGSARAFDGMQPDPLFQDFVFTADGIFQVDLPNGKYHVIMNIDCPGGFWGEVQRFTNRQVAVNDKTVIDEKMTSDDFAKKYWRNAHKEDAPGLDTFEQFVQTMFDIKQFDVDVTDGKAVFNFKCDGSWGITLSAMVIYPQSKADAGKKFWDWTTEQRRAMFNDYFKQVVPKAVGAKPPVEGYAVFSRGNALPANGNDGPQPQDAIPADGLSYSIAKDEEQSIRFVVQPGSDIGEIDLQVSDFVGSNGAKLDPKSFQPGWIDYRITRVTGDGAVYSSLPRYWHPTPAPSAKVTRNFWIRTKVVGGAAPGKYTGKVTIKPKNAPAKEIAVAITVMPFSLDPADIPAGPWSHTLYFPWDPSDPKTVQWQEKMFPKVLDALHDNGFTTVSALPNIGVKAAGGKVELDFTRADKEMKALRDHGFNMMISSYGAGLGYNMHGDENGPDEAFAQRAGFANAESFFRALYARIEEHARSNNWVPIAWNLCDEPQPEAATAAAKNAALHAKVAADLGLKLQTFMGCTSMLGSDPKNPHYDLVAALPMPSLTTHDEASVKLILDKGHKLSYYNDGSRWTYGRYMKALAANYGLAYRVTWHLSALAGDPYYALDTREDDYCFYNTDENMTLVPSMTVLNEIMPGLNDYRYLTTLERLLKEKANSSVAGEARKVYEEQINLVPGRDHNSPIDPAAFDKDRQAVIKAIMLLLESK
jgi:hypothetical protein